MCSFCWGEPARLTHQKQVRAFKRRVFYLFFDEFIDLFFNEFIDLFFDDILGRRYERGLGDLPLKVFF